MELTPRHIDGYVDLLRAMDPDPAGAPDPEKIRAAAAAGVRVLARTRILADFDDRVVASIRTEPIQPAMWILTGLKVRPDPTAELLDAATGLIPEAFDCARAGGARKIESRIPVESIFPAYLAALAALGFARTGGRIEFAAAVADLPDDTGTPLSWVAASSETLPQAGDLLNRIAARDPGHDPADDWREILPALLADVELNGSPECVHFARHEGETAGIAVAQVAPATGWSRITYMGVLPPFAGRGLGRWIHRHGFVMMRAQGGRTYEGGTCIANAPMLALFREHGCRETRVFEEWAWKA